MSIQPLDGLEKFSVYLCAANILRDKDELKRAYYYDDAYFVTKGPARLNTCNDNIFFPVLMVQYIRNMLQPADIALNSPT